MKKYFPHISSLVFTLILISTLSGFIFPQIAHAVPCESVDRRGNALPKGCTGKSEDFKILDGEGRVMTGGIISTILDLASDVLLAPLGWLSILILQIAHLLVWLAGTILNAAIQLTVVDMSTKISAIGGINSAWSAIRDIANMGFIFILLYAAIRTILGIGDDVKKLIINVIVVAILINFSLFFTKIIIDISNVLAIFFYDAIAPSALTNGVNLGISGKLMQPLHLTSIMKSVGGIDAVFEGKKLIIVGIMGTILTLIAAFVFFAIAIMFVIRFVVLIFVLILSPIAFMAFVLPQLKKYADQWTEALLGQAFFAPIYFILTWIVIKISAGLLASSGGDFASLAGVPSASGQGDFVAPPAGSIAILLNFFIVIGLLISSLVIAKEWSNKAGGMVAGLNKWASDKAGGATLGMAGRFGRNVIGSRADAMVNDDELKKKAAQGSVRAKLQLAAAGKIAKSSFDIRGSGLTGSLDAGKAQKGGFAQDQKDRAKAYEKYKPSKDTTDKAKADVNSAKQALANARTVATTAANTAVPQSPELIEAENQLRVAQETAAQPSRLVGISEEDQTAQRERNSAAVTEAQRRVETARATHQQARRQFIENTTQGEHDAYALARLKRAEINNRMERMAKKTEGWRGAIRIPGIMVSGKVKAAAIRTAKKGESKKDKALKAVKDWQEEESPAEPAAPGASPTSPAEGTPPTS